MCDGYSIVQLQNKEYDKYSLATDLLILRSDTDPPSFAPPQTPPINKGAASIATDRQVPVKLPPQPQSHQSNCC